MSCLSWNCRGIGNPRTVQELINMVRMERPDVVFLMETLAEESKLEQIRVILRYDNKLVCLRDGHSGGLALFWKNTFPLAINNYSKYHIDATIQCSKQGRWRLTGFYGHPETCKRQESWEFLRHLSRDMDMAWVCLGDFNEILSIDEKWGGGVRGQKGKCNSSGMPWMIVD